jgi:hypothetical protein
MWYPPPRQGDWSQSEGRGEGKRSRSDKGGSVQAAALCRDVAGETESRHHSELRQLQSHRGGFGFPMLMGQHRLFRVRPGYLCLLSSARSSSWAFAPHSDLETHP